MPSLRNTASKSGPYTSMFRAATPMSRQRQPCRASRRTQADTYSASENAVSA